MPKQAWLFSSEELTALLLQVVAGPPGAYHIIGTIQGDKLISVELIRDGEFDPTKPTFGGPHA